MELWRLYLWGESESYGLFRSNQFLISSFHCVLLCRKLMIASHRAILNQVISCLSQGGKTPWLVDFGIARLSDLALGATALTQTGEIMGSLLYMSPDNAGQALQIFALIFIRLVVVCLKP
jgi:hypothetical protein